MRMKIMKKIRNIAMLLLSSLLIFSIFSGCANKNPVLDLVIESRPNKVLYIVGETFENDGLSVTAIYRDGKVIDVTDSVSLSNPDMSVVGTKFISVTYSNIKKSFQIAVVSKPVESLRIDSLPNKTDFLRGDTMDFTGLKVTAVYNDSTEEEVTRYTISSTDTSTVGQKRIGVFYGGQSVFFDVNILNNPNMPQIMFTPFSTTETKFLYDSFSSAKDEPVGSGMMYRFADGNVGKREGYDIEGGFWVYLINTQSPIDEAIMTLTMGGNYRVDVSFDNTNWQQIAKYSGNDDYNRQPRTFEFRLHDFVDNFDQNNGEVFIRFYSKEAFGFGVFLLDFRLDYKLVDPLLFKEPIGVRNGETPPPESYAETITFLADGNETELEYLFTSGTRTETFIIIPPNQTYNFGISEGTTYRTSDVAGAGLTASSFIYKFDLESKLSNARLTYTAAAADVEVSLDNQTWYNLSTVDETVQVATNMRNCWRPL